MSILLRKKYDSIKRDKLSDTAKNVLKSMYDATNGFKDATASRKIKPKFDAFYEKLQKSKPEAIKGASSKTKETPSSKQFKEARERRKSQTGVPKSNSDIKKDAVRPAIDRKGKRVTDGKHYPYEKGNVYYEYRDNRYDKRPAKYPKLEDGGMMANGGEVFDANYWEDYYDGDKKHTFGGLDYNTDVKHSIQVLVKNQIKEWNEQGDDNVSNVAHISDLALKFVGKKNYISYSIIDAMIMQEGSDSMANGGETHRLEQVFEEGGELEEGNLEMVQSNVKAIEHHASELKNLLKEGTPIEAWVVAKLERAETDLSDVTHYIDGLKGQEKEEEEGYFAKGGKLSTKEYKLVPMIPYGVKGYTQPDYKNTIRFEGTEEQATEKAKELVNSNPNFVQVEIKVEMKTKVLTVGIVEGSNKEYADGGMMAKGGELSKFKVGDKVMISEGYTKMFTGFDITKPATIIKVDKKRFDGNVKYLYYVKLSDGEKPFNPALESRLTLVEEEMEKGGKMAKGEETKKPRAKRTSTLDKLKKGGKLVGNQKKLDVNKNGKLDAQDFKKLREQRKAKK